MNGGFVALKLLVSTVLRGTQAGAAHGELYLIDLDQKAVSRVFVWNDDSINWRGFGGERGLRGMAVDGDLIYVAAGNQLLALNRQFSLLHSWRNGYLNDCQDLCIYKRTLYAVSRTYDSVLGFDLDRQVFNWALNADLQQARFSGSVFDPESTDGPLPMAKLELNSVQCNQGGMYLAGFRTNGLLHFSGESLLMAVELPVPSRNARPFRGGILFNDAESDCLRYIDKQRREDRAMTVPQPPTLETDFDIEDSRARPGIARGLCVLSESVVASGTSPASVSLYNLPANQRALTVTLSDDVRCQVGGIALFRD